MPPDFAAHFRELTAAFAGTHQVDDQLPEGARVRGQRVRQRAAALQPGDQVALHCLKRGAGMLVHAEGERREDRHARLELDAQLDEEIDQHPARHAVIAGDADTAGHRDHLTLGGFRQPLALLAEPRLERLLGRRLQLAPAGVARGVHGGVSVNWHK